MLGGQESRLIILKDTDAFVPLRLQPRQLPVPAATAGIPLPESNDDTDLIDAGTRGCARCSGKKALSDSQCALCMLRLVASTVSEKCLSFDLPDCQENDDDATPPGNARHRDIFPLPLLLNAFPDVAGDLASEADIVLALTNNMIWAVNRLYGVAHDVPVRSKPLLAQKAIQRRFWDKTERMVRRISICGDVSSGAHAWARFTAQESKASSGQFAADKVDIITPSAKVDPMCYLPADVKRSLHPSVLFASAPQGLRQCPGIKDKDRHEYILLVARQLRAQKVALLRNVRAGGTVFGVSKKDSTKVREVWHGKRVSETALPPPAPPHLASPGALLDLESSAEAPIRMNKRDGKCLFDQLRLPQNLRSFMARPPVRVRELIEFGGMSEAELQQAVPQSHKLRLHELVYPVSSCWPMGFSWSSYVAQCTMLGVCRRAGLRTCRILADDLPTPACLDHVFALATDDVMEFCRGSYDQACANADRLDSAMEAAGIVKNPDKDVNGALSATCIGVDLDSGLYLTPQAPKLSGLLACLVQLLCVACVSPYGLAAILGVVQWFDQLARPMFAILDHSYAFARLPKPNTPQHLPAHVREELLLVLAMAPAWEADLTRPWLERIIATDASTSYGFGISSCKCSVDMARRLGRLSEKRGDFVRLDTSQDDAGERRDRIGNPHQLHLKKASFKTELSLRSRFPAPPGALECSALVLMLRWLCRSVSTHAHRVVVLVDAKAVLGAAAKGRSSAPSIKRQLRKLAALTICGDYLIRYIYIPTEDNPADAPSRGESCRGPQTDAGTGSNGLQYYEQLERGFQLQHGASTSSVLEKFLNMQE